MLPRRRSNTKIIASIIVICFLSVSLNQYAVSSEPLNDSIPLCYGFILPNAILDNKTLENQIFCKIRHLVNDLLREDISVFWTSSNMTINVSKINNGKIEENLLFEKGSFIVPFTGVDIVDLKIIAIVCDYNQSSEIEQNNNAKTPVYLLKEQISFDGYDLSNVKILNFMNFLTCGESWYVDVAFKCGFLNYDFVYNDNTSKKLEDSDYNLLIWPGYDLYYPSLFAALEIILDFPTRRNRAIRDFVGKGGGFVGSCQAVFMAARGMKPLPAYPSILTQYPNLPSIGLLSISDIVTASGLAITKDLEQEILDKNHPVVYGVDHYLTGGFLIHGPKIIKIGESVNVIANFKNDSYLDGTPSIVSNNFGDGKVVLFSPHSEIRDPDTGPKFWDGETTGTYNGKKLITNAFYYTTAQGEAELGASEPRNLSFIADVWDKTRDLSDLLNEQEDIFGEIEADIDESIENVADIIDRIYSILETIEQIGIEQNVDPAEIKDILYYGGNKYLLYCFDLIKIYLENTSTAIQTIEKIYPLLEDDADFIEQLEQLKFNLSIKIGKIQEILSTSAKKLRDIENILETYRKHQLFRKFMEKIVKKISHDIEIQTEYAFQLMPGGYFNSLKFLRHHWYNYETSILI
ncbi:MAG: hypothetical protein KAW45_04350 [Thermoplasmatales archaeon]|nr:hypothetical protein [Thermoplasmatales archaeon]